MASSISTGGIPKTSNPDIIKERNRATFNPELITNLLDGGSSTQTSRRRFLEQLIERDPSGVFSNDDNPFLHRSERHVRALAKMVRLIEICRSIGIGVHDHLDGNQHIVSEKLSEGEVILSKDWFTLINAVADDLPTALHWVMFVPNIISLCDEEQQARWLPLCRDWKMIGCYAQTELGHGSNVRGLETTATFVKEGQEADGKRIKGGSWVIHSPKLTSIKFWPGTLGRTCNHAMVIARLIDGQGKDRGVHNFLVQTRSMVDHKLMPGVITGDIGPKIGLNNMDNGFAQFTNVVIPRRNMAMRFATVDENGIYQKVTQSDAASKAAYITMMQVRAYIILEASKHLSRALIMSIRYSAVRRQGFRSESQLNKDEVAILDYKQQQYRLFPLLASAYCFFFTGTKVLRNLKSIEQGLVSLASGNANITKTQVGDIHASTSALKSFTTTIAADGIEDCRKACGGHGFLQCSGFPELMTTYLQNPTVEGDNQMLPMQVVKVLLKLVQVIQSGDEDAIAEWEDCDARYLIQPVKNMLLSKHSTTGTNPKCTANKKEDVMDVQVLLDAYQHRSGRLLVEVAQQIQSSVKNGEKFENAWNGALIQMGRVSRAHSQYILLKNFVDGIQEQQQPQKRQLGSNVNNNVTLGPNEINVLKDLALLFGLYWIDKEVGDFLEDSYLNSQQARWIRRSIIDMLDKIRPNAVALVDANDVSDFRLKSALGRFDGNVYEAIVESSKRDPLNQTEPGPGYEQHLRRLIVDGVGVYTGTASRL